MFPGLRIPLYHKGIFGESSHPPFSASAAHISVGVFYYHFSNFIPTQLQQNQLTARGKKCIGMEAATECVALPQQSLR